MSDNPNSFPVSQAEVLMSLLERGSRELHEFICKPPQNFPVEGLRSHIARLYSYSEELVGIAEAARAQAQADAEKNGTAPADQVN
jgi:hypothetical protein